MSALDRTKRLIEALRGLIDGEFNGYIKINFSQGSLGRVEKFEEIDGDEVALPKPGRVNLDKKI